MLRAALCLILTLGAAGCRNKDTLQETGTVDTSPTLDSRDTDSGTPTDSGLGDEDADSDGHTSDVDCDDDDPAVHPAATELCNGVDDDCDLLIDDDDPDLADGTAWYGDLDGDSWGDGDNTVTACEAPASFVATDGDCDDGAADVNPDAAEVCNGLDDDCDGLVDDDDDSVSGRDTWYLDEDQDGFGGTTDIAIACEVPDGYVDNADDCDDSAATAYPGAGERCNDADDDCDLAIDEGAEDAVSWFSDVDGDGYGDPGSSVLSCDPGSGFVVDDTDCDDGDADVSPGASEVCNGHDDDCDGLVDDDDPSLDDPDSWYDDTDGDGYGDPDAETLSCSQPSDTVADDTDCDDGDADVSPSASEVCNGDDDDCDALVDDDDPDLADGSTWFLDLDGDGYGDAAVSVSACEAPGGYVSNSEDCDDGSADVLPGGTEVCDGIDNDCSGVIDDDATDAATWYADSDGDGYGNATSAQLACEAPSGAVADSTDCDDSDAGVNPGAAEVCDGDDEDCDGLVDDDDPGVTDPSTWYADSDGDGHGDPSASTVSCEAPTGSVANADDCDDSSALALPGGTEVCDGLDNDCDGTTDQSATDAATWYGDKDGDGYGDAGNTTTACEAPTGATSDSSDCDDTDATAYPGASERCDGADQDCDTVVDEDATDATDWYADADGDGYGDSTDSVADCGTPTGRVSDPTDCDDGDSAVNPGATDSCDGADNDCSGLADDTGTCPCAVEHDGDRPYLFCETALDWNSASSSCATYGYHLVSIADSTENDWVDAAVDSYSTEKWWIGLNDQSSEGTWAWDGGESVTYTNWASGEPNDSGGDEDCVQLNRFHPDTTWNDEPCASSFRYVCEFG